MIHKDWRDLVENEREWRKWMIKKISEIEAAQTNLMKEVTRLQVWNWIGRAAILGAMGGVITWINNRLG